MLHMDLIIYFRSTGSSEILESSSQIRSTMCIGRMIRTKAQQPQGYKHTLSVCMVLIVLPIYMMACGALLNIPLS